MEFIPVTHYNAAVQDPNLVPLEDNIIWENPDYAVVDQDGYISPKEAGVLGGPESFDEQFSGGEYQQTQSVPTDPTSSFGVSAIHFDLAEELVWVGNQNGHITSYYGSCLQKYTAFQTHSNHEVRQIYTMDDGVLALTQNSLRMQHRRGLPIFTHNSANMEDMQCLLPVSSNRILLGGHQDQLIDYNLTRCEETKLFNVGENGCAMLRQHSKFICAGDPFGRIDFRDPLTLKVEHTLETHNGSLSDFDVQGNYLVTCGFSNTRQGLSVDKFLMVYDIRQMKAVNPISTMVYPLLLKFMPSYSSRLSVVSPLGQMQLVDSIYPNVQQPMTCLYQVATGGAMILSLDISPTSQCLCFGDSMGSIHLMTTNVSETQFNSFSRPTEFVDTEDNINIDIDDDSTPLSIIPLVYNSNTLLSDWPEEFLKKEHRKTPMVDAEIIKTMKMQGSIGYALKPPRRSDKNKK